MFQHYHGFRRKAYENLPQISLFFVIFLSSSSRITTGHKDWSNSAYPDLRGPSFRMCASRFPENSLLYICDPDRIFNGSELMRINGELETVARSTPCPCQRRSQCSVHQGSGSLHGFIVSIALVDNLQMNFHSPSEQQLTDRAESFCKTLEGRWALGDCGNSVIVFVWRHYKKVVIWPARLAANYITTHERKKILTRVNDLIQNDKWSEAISMIITEMYGELKGEPENRVDTGTLSLVIAVGVASLLTILVTCCVCAFRCCGSQPTDDSGGTASEEATKKLNHQKYYSGGAGGYDPNNQQQFLEGLSNHHHQQQQFNSRRTPLTHQNAIKNDVVSSSSQFPPLNLFAMTDTTVV